jgi:hypothetical protein
MMIYICQDFLGSRFRGLKVLIRTLNQQKKILFSSKTFPFFSIQFQIKNWSDESGKIIFYFKIPREK